MDFKAVNSFLLGHICEKRTAGKEAKMKSLEVRVRLPIGRHDVRMYILDHKRTAGGLRAPPPRLCVT